MAVHRHPERERLDPQLPEPPHHGEVLADMRAVDALEESGADERLVKHLRIRGLHFRGCWVVDLVLGKL